MNENKENNMNDVFDNNDEIKTSNNNKIMKIGVLAVLIIFDLIIFWPKGKKNNETIEASEKVKTELKSSSSNKSISFQKEEKINENKYVDLSTFQQDEQLLREQKEYDSLIRAANINNPVRKSTSLSNNGLSVNLNSNMPTVKEPTAPYKYKLPNSIKKRMDQDYQAMVDHLSSNRSRGLWEASKSDYRQYLEKKDLMDKVEEPLMNLYEGAGNNSIGSAITLGSGTRILAITEQEVSSDHPGYFTARISRPYELRGSKLLCKSGTNNKGRIPCSIDKIITKTGEEVSINGQIDMDGTVGLKGRIHSKWYKRMGPALLNAGIGGGFVAWQMQNEVDSVRIDSRDAVYGPIVQSSVEGLQNEITKLGRDYPDEVKIKKGVQFGILLTSPFKVKI